ncbi:MAG: DAHL domain-containing protein [Cyanobacteria bacterium P01_D01_bin.156]
MKHKLIILSATASTLLLWVGLLIQCRPISTKDHLAYKDALAKQLQYDLNVNQAVLETRQVSEPNDVRLATAIEQLDNNRKRLQTVPAFLNQQNNQANQHLQNTLQESNTTLKQKVLLAEQFRVDNARIQESLSQLPVLLEQSSSNVLVGESLDQPLVELFNQVLLYGLSLDDSLRSEISTQITQIQSLSDEAQLAERDTIQIALDQSRFIVENKPAVDELTQSLLAVPTTEQLQTLIETYEVAYQQANARTQRFQLAAIIWGLVILSGAAYGWMLKNQFRRVGQIADTLFESMDDASMDVDHQWVITNINGPAAEDLNKPSEELIGHILWTVLPKELGQEKKHYYEQAISQQSHLTLEARLTAQDRWIEMSLTPMSTGLSLSWHDISSHKRAEFQLALSLEANDEALRKADEAREKAEAERVKAEQASQAKSEFLANMSHELRTPLNAIIGYSELLEEDAEDLGQTEFIPELKRIQGAGKHLLGLIDGVLDLSKVEAGKMELDLETFKISSLIKDVVSTVQPVIAKSNNTLRIHCPDNIGEMHADTAKVRQSLFNLLSNANKFTHNGTITLSVQSITTEGTTGILFQVQDTGIGMLPDQLKRVFHAFAQADSSTTRKYGGTGLGLTITQKFVQMMGGTVDVKSEMGVGTTFTVCLPKTVQKGKPIKSDQDHQSTLSGEAMADTSESVSAETIDQSSDLESTSAPCLGCVLVIDENLEDCEAVRQLLVQQGYFVILSHNNERGLNMAEQLLPDIILLDVMMSKVDGWRIIRTIREHPKLSNIPVVLHTMQADNELGYSLGATDYVSKPVQSTKLLAVLEKYRPQHAYAYN